MPKPFKHKASGRWAVQFGAKLSGTGKPKMVYYSSLDAARTDVRRREAERKEHGVSLVTGEDRQWLAFLKSQVNDLAILPEVIEHWKATGAGSVTATTVEHAVAAFLEHQLPQVEQRTQSDIRSRLKAFCAAFEGRHLHSLHSGELEKWLHTYRNSWTRRSYWKRISPLFDYALRNRMLAENPLAMLEAPRTKRVNVRVYTPTQFVAMLEWSQQESYNVMLPFLALSGLCFVRTSELVRLYKNEQVMEWSDILWDRRLVHVRGEVAKQTRRDSDERFPPFGEPFEMVMAGRHLNDVTGMIIPIMNGEFSKLWRRMHAELGIKPIPNGMRKSCISYTLAARPELGIPQAAKWAGSSEATVKKFYLERLTQKDGERWFELPMLF